MNKFILLALVAMASTATLPALNEETELDLDCTDPTVLSHNEAACATQIENNAKDADKNLDNKSVKKAENSGACLGKEDSKECKDLKDVAGDATGIIIGCIFGVCCLCCVLPLIVWCVFIKAATSAAAENMNQDNFARMDQTEVVEGQM